jgi:hypothetical protein
MRSAAKILLAWSVLGCSSSSNVASPAAAGVAGVAGAASGGAGTGGTGAGAAGAGGGAGANGGAAGSQSGGSSGGTAGACTATANDCPLQGLYNGFVTFAGLAGDPGGCFPSLGPGTFAESVTLDIRCGNVGITAVLNGNVPIAGTIDGLCHVHAETPNNENQPTVFDFTLDASSVDLTGSYVVTATSAMPPCTATYDLTGMLNPGAPI